MSVNWTHETLGRKIEELEKIVSANHDITKGKYNLLKERIEAIEHDVNILIDEPKDLSIDKEGKVRNPAAYYLGWQDAIGEFVKDLNKAEKELRSFIRLDHTYAFYGAKDVASIYDKLKEKWEGEDKE